MDDRRDDQPRAREAGRPVEGARSDEAVFDVARVGGGRAARPMWIATLTALAIGGLALAGVLGRGAPAPGPELQAEAAPAPTTMRDVAATRMFPASPAPPASTPAAPPRLLALHTRAWGPFVYVQGEVLALDAEVVVVSIWSPDDRVLERKTISLPSGSTAFRLGADDPFQLVFEVPGVAAQAVAYVHARAYDGDGLPIASERQWLSPAVDPGWWRREGGA